MNYMVLPKLFNNILGLFKIYNKPEMHQDHIEPKVVKSLAQWLTEPHILIRHLLFVLLSWLHQVCIFYSIVCIENDFNSSHMFLE
jgi:hypothetical protein